MMTKKNSWQLAVGGWQGRGGLLVVGFWFPHQQPKTNNGFPSTANRQLPTAN
jgi:hypothetical protein